MKARVRKRSDLRVGPASIETGSTVDHEEIARLAYAYWEARGGNWGSPQEDWFRAEQELILSRSKDPEAFRGSSREIKATPA
jgi:DUF2934 family protein